MMTIEHEEKEGKGSFFIDENGVRLAELAYTRSADGEIDIYHTEVSPNLRGEGIGQDLVAAAVNFARSKGFKVVATCPYAENVLSQHPAF